MDSHFGFLRPHHLHDIVFTYPEGFFANLFNGQLHTIKNVARAGNSTPVLPRACVLHWEQKRRIGNVVLCMRKVRAKPEATFVRLRLSLFSFKS